MHIKQFHLCISRKSCSITNTKQPSVNVSRKIWYRHISANFEKGYPYVTQERLSCKDSEIMSEQIEIKWLPVGHFGYYFRLVRVSTDEPETTSRSSKAMCSVEYWIGLRHEELCNLPFVGGGGRGAVIYTSTNNSQQTWYVDPMLGCLRKINNQHWVNASSLLGNVCEYHYHGKRHATSSLVLGLVGDNSVEKCSLSFW